MRMRGQRAIAYVCSWEPTFYAHDIYAHELLVEGNVYLNVRAGLMTTFHFVLVAIVLQL